MTAKLSTILVVIFIASITSCGLNLKSNNDKLIDGWYLPSKTATKNIRPLSKWAGRYYNLEKTPIISFEEIDSIRIELETEPDSSLELYFILTPQAQKKYNEIVSIPNNEEFVFLLNDTVINFHKIYSDVQRREQINLTLSYSDFTQKEIDKIVSELSVKIKK